MTLAPAGALDAERAQAHLHQMLRVRRFEEKCAELYSAQKIRGFLHLYIGEEAAAVGVLANLEPHDAVVGTYREHGHALVRGISARSVMAEMFGKVTGCSRGRGGSMHLFDRDLRFYGGSAIVAAGLPLAVGLALADAMQDRSRVTACFFGDGATAEGAFYESVNLAVLWHLPVLFCCENNLYAMGTALHRHQARTDLAAKAAALGLAADVVDGMDVLQVDLAARRAVDAVRAGEGPGFLELRTYRFRAHSMFDADRYRSRAEVEDWKKRDPIPALTAELRARDLIDAPRLAALEQEVAEELADAVDFAERSDWEPVEDLGRHVCCEAPS